jgi:hypothetical protein
MKRLIEIIVIFALMILSAHSGMAQNPVQQTDSLKIQEHKDKNELTSSDQNLKGSGYQKFSNSNGNSAVKKVRSGKPDMSKARGARPPAIIRPSGSGVPKGVGKPAGAGRKPGR